MTRYNIKFLLTIIFYLNQQFHETIYGYFFIIRLYFMLFQKTNTKKLNNKTLIGGVNCKRKMLSLAFSLH